MEKFPQTGFSIWYLLWIFTVKGVPWLVLPNFGVFGLLTYSDVRLPTHNYWTVWGVGRERPPWMEIEGRQHYIVQTEATVTRGSPTQVSRVKGPQTTTRPLSNSREGTESRFYISGSRYFSKTYCFRRTEPVNCSVWHLKGWCWSRF